MTEQLPAPRLPMPTSVKVAVVVMAVLGSLLLANALLSWLGRGTLVAAIVEAQPAVTTQAAEQSVLLFALSYAVVGLLLATSAVALGRRRRWGRWSGLTATLLVTFTSLTSAAAAGGAGGLALLVLLLALVAVAALLVRPTREWLAQPADRT